MNEILICFAGILTALDEIAPASAPGGHLYAGLMDRISAWEFSNIMLVMVSQGLVNRSGESYSITDKGREKAAEINAAIALA